LKDLKDYIDLLFSVNDPILYSIFLVFFLFLTVYAFFKYILYPIQKKYVEEKKEYELKNARLMALFAELDPDPVVRIDTKGTIIHANEVAKNLDHNESIIGKNVAEFFPRLESSPEELIKENKSFTLSYQSSNKYYEVWFRGVKNLEIAQLYFKDLTERNLFEKELVKSKTKLQELSNRLQDKVEEERQRISRELHDSVGQNLLFIKLMLQNSNLLNPDNCDENNKITSALETSIIELKRILFDLKPRILEEAGLNAAISLLCANISSQTSIKGYADFIGNEERLNSKLEICIYRIIQEGLSNIVKHSQADSFNILIINSANSIRVVITDDGIGFQQDKSSLNPHFGLMNMKERIQNFNGTFRIETEESKGSILIVEIPKN
jgi:signal transduction histidine kinase